VARLRALKAVLLAVPLAVAATTEASALRAVETVPVAESVIVRGSNSQYVVRFDKPIDHYAARMEIVQNGRVVERLQPLEDSAAETLFAEAPVLAPGQYELRWSATTGPAGETASGTVPFSVRP
jgi:methionine-rich copper-binding protein CopC